MMRKDYSYFKAKELLKSKNLLLTEKEYELIDIALDLYINLYDEANIKDAERQAIDARIKTSYLMEDK